MRTQRLRVNRRQVVDETVTRRVLKRKNLFHAVLLEKSCALIVSKVRASRLRIALYVQLDKLASHLDEVVKNVAANDVAVLSLN